MIDEEQLDLVETQESTEDEEVIYQCFICGQWHDGQCDIEVIERLLSERLDT